MRPSPTRVRLALGDTPADLHTTVSELFRVGMELQAIARRRPGTSVEVRLQALVAELDDVIRELRRSPSSLKAG